MDEKDLLMDTAPMIRLSRKAKLLKDCMQININLAKNESVNSKRFNRIARRSIERDMIAGLKIINKNIPVFVELPKVQKEGNGQVSEVRENEDDDKPKEIDIYDSDLLDYSQ